MRDHTQNSTALNLGPLQTNKFGERYFYQLNRGSFAKISAQALYKGTFSESLFKANTLNVIIGTDSGLLPQHIIQNGIPNGSRYLFIEPSGILAQLHANDLLSKLPPEICCTSPEDWEAQAATFKIVDYFHINAVQSVNSIAAQEASFEDYPELSWQVTEKLSESYWGHSMTLAREDFMVCQMQNVADNILPASILKNSFKGQTALILAGGPSLDDALPWVKENRERLIIFAVSRIARQLLQHGIDPDFICSVDPSSLSFDISKEMLNFSDKTTFLYAYHTVPKLVQQWRGKALYLGDRLPWKSSLNPKNFDGAGPTVTNAAISTAYAFGFTRIILAGVDLCFTRDGYTHAKGSDEALSGPRFGLTSLQAETNGGDFAPTSCDFMSAIHSLAAQARFLAAKGCQVINPSKNAAKIAHIDYLPLTHIALTDHVQTVMAEAHQRLEHAQHHAVNNADCLLKELHQAHYQITAIQALAKEAIEINQAMYSPEGIIEDYKNKRRLDKIEQQLKRQYRKFSNTVKSFGIRQFIKITRPFEDAEMTADEAKALCNTYYQAYHAGAEKFLVLIEDAISRVEARQEETRPQPDFAKLLTQWEQDQSFGRATFWPLDFKPAIPAEVQTTLHEYTQKFQAIIDDKNTDHLIRAKNYASLATFKNRAKLLYKHGKATELKDLKAGLEKHPDSEAAADYKNIATAYIADIEGDFEHALMAYQAVIDGETKSLFEDALLRIANISLSLGDQSNSYLALQCLSQLSPMHLPMYAELNSLLGKPEAAAELYYEYINQFPSDTVVQLKLATLLIDNQHYASADVMLDYILTKRPDSIAALALKAKIPAFFKTIAKVTMQTEDKVSA